MCDSRDNNNGGIGPLRMNKTSTVVSLPEGARLSFDKPKDV